MLTPSPAPETENQNPYNPSHVESLVDATKRLQNAKKHLARAREDGCSAEEEKRILTTLNDCWDDVERALGAF